MRHILTGAALLLAAPAVAQDQPGRAEGLAAWERIYAVTQHPRCANCHVGADGLPMWEGLGYGPGAFPVSEGAAQDVLSLPIYAELSTEQQAYVVDCIRTFYASAGARGR